MMRTAGLSSLRRLEIPIAVPLVPNVATTAVTAPPVCSQISKAVLE